MLSLPHLLCGFPISSPVCSLHPGPFLLTQPKLIGKWEEIGRTVILIPFTETGLLITNLDLAEKIRIQFKPCLQITTPTYYSLLNRRLREQIHQLRLSML